jgi:uncharacterized protein (TIGR03437 family)
MRLLFIFLVTVVNLFPQTWPNKEDKDHALERQRWFYSQRAQPNGIPAGARRAAIQQLQRLDADARARRQALRTSPSASQAFVLTTDSANWTPIGPRPTDPGASSTSGRVNAIAIDPRSNDVVYIGGADGGVWKTVDAGQNWRPLTDSQPSLAMGAIAIDPSNPDTVYAGTGELNFAGDSYYGAGILKSTDAGATWTNTEGPFNRDYISNIAVHPSSSDIVMVAARSGIYRSADGGASWSVTMGGVSASSLFFDAADPNIVWAALGDAFGTSRNGVYRSTDAGLTWRSVPGTAPQTLPTNNVGRIELTQAPSAPATLYAQIQDSATNTFGNLLGIWKTTDAGATWTKLPVPASSWGPQLWYDNTLRVSPTDPNLLWSGALQIYRSTDGGFTWSLPAQTSANGTSIHVDFHALAFTKDGSRLYIGNDGGMYRTDDVSASRVNWTSLNTSLALTQFYPGMALDATDPAVIVGGTQDNGIQRQTPDGRWSNITCGDGSHAAIDPAFPNLLYSSCQKIAIQRSSTPGVWLSAQYGIDRNDPEQFIAPFVADPATGQTLYFGTTRVWQSRDSGGKWTAISGDITGALTATTSIKSIAVAPSDSNTVYAGTDRGRLSVTTDALKGSGATWTDRSAGLPARAITSISVDPINPATAWVTFSGFASGTALPGYIYKTTNAGANWTNVSGNMPISPVNDLIVDPDLPDTLIAGTDIGVILSADGGNTWATLGHGLPTVVVTTLALHRSARVLRAGTHGRSVWEIAIPLNQRSLAPAIDSISPARADTGSAALTLNIVGSGFVPGTVLRWNGQDRPTQFTDASHISASIPASDLSAPGRAAVAAFNASSGGGLSQPKGFVIGAAPASATNAFVSAADPSGGNAVAPRSIASLYGTNLATGIASADGGAPLPFTLADTTLSINGFAAPFFFVSPGQLNFQIPLTGLIGTQLLTVTQGSQSTSFPITLRSYSPALFTANAQGTGQASTVIAGTASLAAPSNKYPGARPARAGEYISIYCTGLGDVSNRPTLGAASPSSPLAQTLVQPIVNIGGIQSTVIFSGLAPGFVGLYQVNVQVPAGIAANPAVPLTLTIGGVTSNTATIAVE